MSKHINVAVEPRSIRLTQAHRTDMVDAVMAEWQKQNPAPASTNHVELLKIVAPQLKKHAAYKRTQRFLAVMKDSDHRHVNVESGINVAIMNKQGEQRNTIQVRFPISLAKKFGLVYVPDRICTSYTSDFAPNDLDPADIIGYDRLQASKMGDVQTLELRCVAFIERSYITVQVNDDSAPMLARKEARQARKAWQSQYNTLSSETADLLANFNTTRQLREGWPDIVPYLPPHIADPDIAVKLPVLATSRLTERLGIKKTTKKVK